MDEYKRMILALPEDFFQGWVWQEGDKFLHKELGSEHWNECVTGDYKADLEGVIWYVVPDYYDRLEGEIRPLPSQKQLQDMIKKHQLLRNVKLNDFDVLQRVYEWHKRRDPEHKLNKITEHMFLEVVQWLNDKTWTGENWI